METLLSSVIVTVRFWLSFPSRLLSFGTVTACCPLLLLLFVFGCYRYCLNLLMLLSLHNNQDGNVVVACYGHCLLVVVISILFIVGIGCYCYCLFLVVIVTVCFWLLLLLFVFGC